MGMKRQGGEGRRPSATVVNSLHILEPVQRLNRLHSRQTAHDTLSHLVQRLGRVCVGWGLVDLLVYQWEGESRGEGGLTVSFAQLPRSSRREGRRITGKGSWKEEGGLTSSSLDRRERTPWARKRSPLPFLVAFGLMSGFFSVGSGLLSVVVASGLLSSACPAEEAEPSSSRAFFPSCSSPS